MRRCSQGWWICWFSICCLSMQSVAAQQKDADRIAAPLHQVLKTYCFDCHDSDEPEAGLDLTHFQTEGSIRRDAGLWKQLVQRVEIGNMPPPEFGEMSEEDRATLSQWVEKTLTELDCLEFRTPGEVTIRRLNRREYRHAIADLLLVDYQPANDFPGDDVGYGFDNIGDVLSLPPLLMEKYLSAAEAISRQVIVAPEDLAAVEVPLAISQWRVGQGVNHGNGGLSFFANGSAEFDFDATRSQTVTIRVRAAGQQAGDEPVRFSFHVDRKRISQFLIESHEEVETFEIETRLLKGRRRLRLTFENDYYNPGADNPRDRDRNLFVHSVHLELSPPVEREPTEPERHFFF
ncbi:MAG TPA: DUF1587 domain-containing protein, partial [Pirellulaceae bacterium]|nr:DUF1587 domain-containing protein [Pirellulaceae bacterium]